MIFTKEGAGSACRCEKAEKWKEQKEQGEREFLLKNIISNIRCIPKVGIFLTIALREG